MTPKARVLEPERGHMSYSCDFTTIIPIKHDLKLKAWIGANRGRSASKSRIWQIVVFITTLLRCHYVKHAADTLLLRCYADRCRPEAAITAFTLRCRYDIQDPTTKLRRPRWLYDDIATVVPIRLRLYYASSTIWRWCIYVLGLKHICHLFPSFKHERTY